MSKFTIKALRYYEKEGLLIPKYVDTYNVYLEMDNIGDVFIVYDEGIQDYLIKGNFKRGGKTTLVLANNDKKYDFKLNILYNKFDVEKMYD